MGIDGDGVKINRADRHLQKPNCSFVRATEGLLFLQVRLCTLAHHPPGGGEVEILLDGKKRTLEMEDSICWSAPLDSGSGRSQQVGYVALLIRSFHRSFSFPVQSFSVYLWLVAHQPSSSLLTFLRCFVSLVPLLTSIARFLFWASNCRYFWQKNTGDRKEEYGLEVKKEEGNRSSCDVSEPAEGKSQTMFC